MEILINLGVFLLIILVMIAIVIRVRSNLLSLWKDVSVKEVIFHRLLLQTAVFFYAERAKLKTEDNQPHFRRMSKYKKRKIRHLLLKERQELFMSINAVYLEFVEQEHDEFMHLVKKFNELQRARRVYNSKVLLYNQSISIFPTRFLAIKMNLQVKEYFG